MEVISFTLGDVVHRESYDRLFENCPDAFIQQSTYWAEVIAELGPDTPIFLLARQDGEAVAGLPLYLFEHRLGNLLTSVPQAGPLGGPFLHPGLSETQVELAYALLLSTALSIARHHRCIALSLITHPFADDLARYERDLAPTHIFDNFTQVIDLRSHFSPEGAVQLPAYLRRSNLSRNLAKARAANLKTRLSTDPDEIDALYSVHVKRHGELGTPPLDRRLIFNIATKLFPRKKAFFLATESSSGVASWGVYIHHRHNLDVLRLTMDTSFASLGSNYHNTDCSLAHARALGIQRYNWQSSPGRNGGVFRYKQQWGARESVYHYVARLLCPPDYLAGVGVEAIKAEYPLHWIIPYVAAPDGFRPGRYAKE